MKKVPLFLLLGIAAAATLRSQDAPSPVPRTYIPRSLEVCAFTPPAPAPVKPIPAMRLDSAVTVPASASRSLTLIRGEASTLPDIPPPARKPQDQRTPPLENPALAAYRRSHSLKIRATIYDHRVSHAQWENPDTGEIHEAACGFDLSLLRGIPRFIHDGESYNLMLELTNIDTTVRRFAQQKVPVVPEVAADSIKIIKGNPQDPSGTAHITLLQELIAHEKSRLVTWQAALLSKQQASAAWHKAHPVIPRDETVWLRPHRGSRYLKPATEGGAP